MKPADLRDIGTDQLVQRYVAIGIDQHEALLRRDHAKFTRLFHEMVAIEEELKARVPDQRPMLLNLYEHPTAQVRLNAMKATLAVTPETARRNLEALAASLDFPQAGDAGMTLYALDRGIFKPT
jgi:hypothetical protein